MALSLFVSTLAGVKILIYSTGQKTPCLCGCACVCANEHISYLIEWVFMDATQVYILILMSTMSSKYFHPLYYIILCDGQLQWNNHLLYIHCVIVCDGVW